MASYLLDTICKTSASLPLSLASDGICAKQAMAVQQVDVHRSFLCSTPRRWLLDTFLLGWGSHLDKHTAQGMWTPRESRIHTNVLAQRAVWEACKQFLLLVQSQCIQVISNNITKVRYINREGGARCKYLCVDMVNPWSWCISHKITLSSVHLPGYTEQ